ncbi:MAG: acetylxylan esterase [Ignavibacteria bacterium]|nr:acetylxylan esterase [Ignavibacteria bacterium]
MKPVGSEAFEVMRQFFNYDKTIPLNVRIVEKLDYSDFVREKIVFSGTRNNRVPGYLAIPVNGRAPYPCVLQLHGIGSSKERWWKEGTTSEKLTMQLITQGFAVLSLDAEYHGERLTNNDFESPEVFIFEKDWLMCARDMIVQSAAEYRRAIDYLEIREDIDNSRLGMIGFSMGGLMTFSISAVEPRIKASVACVTPIIKDQYSAINVYNFAPHIKNRPFLMQVGKTDEFNYTTEEARQLFDLISSQTKEIIIYESGHILPDEWTFKTTEWMEKYLK